VSSSESEQREKSMGRITGNLEEKEGETKGSSEWNTSQVQGAIRKGKTMWQFDIAGAPGSALLFAHGRVPGILERGRDGTEKMACKKRTETQPPPRKKNQHQGGGRTKKNKGNPVRK